LETRPSFIAMRAAPGLGELSGHAESMDRSHENFVSLR